MPCKLLLLSPQFKRGKDRIFANEWELKDENDTDILIKEAKLIEATGAGITGGDPLIVWKRTKNYVLLLKDEFESDFNIHLYTSGIVNAEHIEDIVTAGLDEIRFHPLPNDWNKMEKSASSSSIKKALKTDADVAIEIPAIPGKEKEIFSLIKWADKEEIKWINLNELEFSETNAKELIDRRFKVKDDISAAVKGSQELATNLIKKCQKEDLKIGVHYCSSSFKDGIQLRNRIKRRAKNIAKDFEIITDDGTLLKGIVLSKNKPLSEIYDTLKKDFKINEKHLFFNKDKKRIELDILILEKIALSLKQKGFECYIVEEYPTADALEVERTPLPL